jgi:hypothetical protein
MLYDAVASIRLVAGSDAGPIESLTGSSETARKMNHG